LEFTEVEIEALKDIVAEVVCVAEVDCKQVKAQTNHPLRKRLQIFEDMWSKICDMESDEQHEN